jgi:two-component system, chemotaxis family, sensor kinase CheA
MSASLLAKAFLPPKITEFERRYVQRINRIALWFFAVHIPVFTLIAFVNHTNPVTAVVLTSAIMLGPVIAHKALDNPRHVALIYGVTAMAMGGLLVHFGQGPVQIEMHFYFFALIAMLAVYGNPAVIYVSALTVALHHLGMWMWLPRSVFNYDASIWVVAVHAAFVVLESIATAFIARSFFDNVIGLEHIVSTRTSELNGRNRDVQLILDNVGQGFLTLDRQGRMSREHSRPVVEWFGAFEPGIALAAYLGAHDRAVGEAIAEVWRKLDDGAMSFDAALTRLPNRMQLGDRQMELQCKAVSDGVGAPDRVVVVISDITSRVERERLQAEQKETAMLVNHMIGDNSAFIDKIKRDPALGRGQRETLLLIYQRFVGKAPAKRSIFDGPRSSADDDVATAKALDEIG